MKDVDEFTDAWQAYGRAQADALWIRDVWIKAGRPLIQESPNGLAGRHPLWRVMLEAEAHAARFRAELGQTPKSAKALAHRRPGRPVGANSAPDRIAPARVTLKSV